MLSIFKKAEPLIEQTVFPYGNIDYPLMYKPNPRAKRLSLRFSTKELFFVLTIPPRTSKSQIQLFLKRCVPWAEKQVSQVSTRLKIVPGTEVKLNGKTYRCVTDPLRKKPALCNETQTMRLPSRLTQKGLHDFLKKKAADYFTPLIEEIASRMGQRIEKVSYRDTKSRWGSCSARKTISLNWRLILAPPEVAHYVCVHEAAHLTHMNHSKDFWNLVEDHCPRHKVLRKWLKTNGTSLLSI